MNTLRQREPRYENRRLLNLCHGAPCMLQFNGCTGGTDGERPSVPCHSNWLEDGKGVGYKAHDFTAVPGCPHCHDELDRRNGTPLATSLRLEIFRNAQRRWWAYLWTNELVRVA